MANLRAIRTRIKSVENTRQITKSMKMVAAAKLRKTQSAFADLRAYADKCAEMLEQMSGDLEAIADSGDQNAAAGASREQGDVPVSGGELWLTPRPEIRTVCYVLIVGNRGLCGTYNQALLRYCENLIKQSEQEAYLIVCGRWGKDLIASAGMDIRESFEVGDNPTHEEALQLAERLKTLYREETVDKIVLIYQHYRTVLSQEPTETVLLPIDRKNRASTLDSTANGDIIYEPDRESLLTTLLNMYIGNTVHAVLLEARTGEHSARMTAMTAAADNTEELISELTLELNHARQAAITTEISEIAGGAEALRNSSAE